MNTKNIFLITCFLLFILSYTPSFAGNADCSSFYTMREGKPCQEFINEFLAEKNLKIIYSEKPAISNNPAHLVLPFHGIEVILPRVRWEHIFILKQAENLYSVFLKSPDNLLISIMVNENTIFDDVYAMTNLYNGNKLSSKDGVASTSSMYGGPVRFSQLMKMAYENSPDQITCCQNNYTDEISKIIPLVLKKFAVNGELAAAYRGVGQHDGWITKSRVEGYVEYVLSLVQKNKPDKIYQITYQIPETIPFHHTPFMVGEKINPQTKRVTPDWLIALSMALKQDSENAWENYFTKAEKAGTSKKSIMKTRNNLNLNSPQPVKNDK